RGGSAGAPGSGGAGTVPGSATGDAGTASAGTGGGAGSGTGGTGASRGSDGGAGASTATGAFVNNYDGARATTESLDSAWTFHLGDVSGAQAAMFDDSSWTTLDVPHDWSIALPFNQSSASGAGGGYLDGGLGWYRKAF